MDREFEPNLEDEREEPLVEDEEEPAPPPTIDPEERIEQPDDAADVALDDDRRV